MKQQFLTFTGITICLLLTLQGVGQKKTMTWTTKSEKAKALATKGAGHMMNIEFAQAYDKFNQALELDPDFTVVLTLMANLSNGAAKKVYAEKALASAGKKTAGEKLFASLAKPDKPQGGNQKIWAELKDLFPDESFNNFFYVLTRATPEEQFAAAEQFHAKFPDVAAIHNMLGYYNLQIKKDTVAAKTHFEKYIQLYPEGCNPYDSMGEFYFLTGDMENSEKYYNLALEKYPFSNSSIDKLKEIKAATAKAKTD